MTAAIERAIFSCQLDQTCRMYQMPRAAEQPQASRTRETMLFLAQLPPPVHGVTIMSERVKGVVEGGGRIDLTHLWLGGAGGLGDINKRSVGKLFAFARLLGTLTWYVVSGRRFSFAYMTFAPWTHAAIRDALLAGFGRLLARRTIIHLHGEGLDKVVSAQSIQSRIVRWLVGGAELVSPTSASAQLARQSGIFSRVFLLPNAVVDPGRPANAATATEQPLRCGILANLDPRKGVLVFIEGIEALVAARLPVKAVIAGASTGFLSIEEAQDKIAGKGLADVIDVVGARYGADKAEFFRTLDLFIYPSLHDHAPLVLIEALSYGLAPIACDTGGIGEILGPDLRRNLLPAGLSVDEMRQAIVTIGRCYVEQPDSLARDKAAARARYRALYSESTFTARLNGVLDGATVDAE